MENKQSTPRALTFDPEYAEWRKPFGSLTNVPLCRSVQDLRKYNDTFTRAVWAQIPPQPTIKRKVYRITSYDGVELEVTRFATTEQLESSTPQPAWLQFHGGGVCALSIEIYAPLLAKQAAESGAQLLAVEYRLAPEHPAPAPVEDCYAALRWASSHAAELNLDPARLGLMGDSGGGALVAGVALLARDRGLEPPVARQLMTYPMLDDRTITRLSPQSPQAPLATFPLQNLVLCWEAYVGKDKAGSPDQDGAVSIYAAPARAADLGGLPPTYIDVGSLDLFRDECATFAARLAAADVDVEFHLFSGVPHGFEAASEISITKAALEGRYRFMRKL
jgi:acetyl esterase/lipase